MCLNKVKELYRKELEKSLDELRVAYEDAKIDVKQAEGRMVTRYDSMKTEMAWVSNSLLAEILSLEETQRQLYKPENVNVGDLVKVRIRKSDKTVYNEEFSITFNPDLWPGIEAIAPGSMKAVSVLGQPVDKLVEVTENGECWTMQIAECIKGHDTIPCIGVYSLVALQEAEFEEEWYLVTSAHGGIFMELEDGLEVAAVSVKAPLAQAMLGKRIGDVIAFQQGPHNRVLTVKQILS